MNTTPRPISWWRTLPGLLTASAAFLTAVAGLIVAAHQAGLFGKLGQAHNDATKTTSGATSVGAANWKGAPIDSTYSVILPPQTEVRARSYSPAAIAVYKILGARLEPYGLNKLSLKLNVRFTNTDQFSNALSDSEFRLLIDGVPQAPEGFPPKLIASQSATEGVIEFVIPDTVTKAELRIGDIGEGAPTMPISFAKR
jgi:hypothetical protein